MKKVLTGIVLLGGMAFLSGCASTLLSENKQVPPVEPIEQAAVSNQNDENFPFLEYTSKNGAVAFKYPKFTFSPDGKEKMNVTVSEENNFVYVSPEEPDTLSEKEKAILTILSQTNITQKEINSFVANSFGDKECTVVFDGTLPGGVLVGAVNGILSDDPKDCAVVNMIALYDTEMKTLIVHNTGKTGDFFFDPNLNDSLNDWVFASIRFANPATFDFTESTYGFTLQFPKSWTAMKTFHRELDWGTFGKGDSIAFGFKEQDSVFTIAVFTKDQWKKVSAEEGPLPQYLGEDATHVFAYSNAQEGPSEEPARTFIADRWNEVDSVVKTFKIK